MVRSGDGVVILGAGGHAREIADAFTVAVAAVFVEPGWEPATPPLPGTPVVTALHGQDFTAYVAAVGDPQLRRRLVGLAAAAGLDAMSVVHPTAVVSSRARLAPGVVCLALSAVSPDADLGAHVHLNQGAIVSHDVVLGDFATVGPRAALTGGAAVGAAAVIGAGAVVLPGISVGAGAMVGAGAVVTRDVPPGVTVVGNPARELGR
jgi:sugar O-acyltransferase (sialic acid O-acetyltransferase NeuD family)